MIISYKEIRARIQKLWPNCKNVWLDDLEYTYPTFDDVKAMIAADHTERLVMRGYQFDCDDFALQLSASINKMWGQNPDHDYPIPFGQVRGRSFQHLGGHHKCNICVLENKIIIIEPQTDEIFFANSEEDDVFFVGVPG